MRKERQYETSMSRTRIQLLAITALRTSNVDRVRLVGYSSVNRFGLRAPRHDRGREPPYRGDIAKEAIIGIVHMEGTEPMSSREVSAPTPFDDGELYDILLGGFDYGLDFYVDLARRVVGPVLDIGCERDASFALSASGGGCRRT